MSVAVNRSPVAAMRPRRELPPSGATAAPASAQANAPTVGADEPAAQPSKSPASASLPPGAAARTRARELLLRRFLAASGAPQEPSSGESATDPHAVRGEQGPAHGAPSPDSATAILVDLLAADRPAGHPGDWHGRIEALQRDCARDGLAAASTASVSHDVRQHAQLSRSHSLVVARSAVWIASRLPWHSQAEAGQDKVAGGLRSLLGLVAGPTREMCESVVRRHCGDPPSAGERKKLYQSVALLPAALWADVHGASAAERRQSVLTQLQQVDPVPTSGEIERRLRESVAHPE